LTSFGVSIVVHINTLLMESVQTALNIQSGDYHKMRPPVDDSGGLKEEMKRSDVPTVEARTRKM